MVERDLVVDEGGLFPRTRAPQTSHDMTEVVETGDLTYWELGVGRDQFLRRVA